MSVEQMTTFDLVEDEDILKASGKKRDILRPNRGVNCWHCLYRTGTFCSKFREKLEVNENQQTYFRLERCQIDTQNKFW